MGIFHDPMRAGIAIIRALAGLDPRTPGAPTVARLAILTNKGDEVCQIELTEAGVENAVTVLEDAADRTAHELSADEMGLFDQLDEVFSHINLDDLTKTVLNNAKPSDRLTVTQAIDGMFGHIPHWDAEDSDL